MDKDRCPENSRIYFALCLGFLHLFEVCVAAQSKIFDKGMMVYQEDRHIMGNNGRFRTFMELLIQLDSIYLQGLL